MTTRTLPMHLWLVLAVLFVQVILNVFGGAVLLYAINSDPGPTPALPDPGLLHFVVWFSLLASAVLAVSALFLVLRNSWARWPVIGIEVLAMLSGLISLVTGATAGLANIALGSCVVWMLVHPEVRDWLADQRPADWHDATPY